MHHSSRDRAKEPNPEIGIENTEPLEQRPPKLRARGDPDLVGLIKSTRLSLTRKISTSKALRAPSIESYIHSPSSSRSRSTTKKLNVNRPTGHKTDNLTIPPEPSDRHLTLTRQERLHATYLAHLAPHKSQS